MIRIALGCEFAKFGIKYLSSNCFVVVLLTFSVIQRVHPKPGPVNINCVLLITIRDFAGLKILFIITVVTKSNHQFTKFYWQRLVDYAVFMLPA